ncbi:hypothetical protein [Streptococcus himalayensis]|uniref:Uncharacterized protein n=1 Tax=Streptococcus himalayensis TaxID=1888195 RepID=A0A917EHJ1_9STRE|nr:hypothetical protein [Streptococcus himalayensis]QBX08383.1 hypothetical protein JavanS256_0011 [Streptococcus satellite phage Javan256]GGE36928.1 hypothetical protein GCM10011510_17870 [Streptococcus himalayensis]
MNQYHYQTGTRDLTTAQRIKFAIQGYLISLRTWADSEIELTKLDKCWRLVVRYTADGDKSDDMERIAATIKQEEQT